MIKARREREHLACDLLNDLRRGLAILGRVLLQAHVDVRRLRLQSPLKR